MIKKKKKNQESLHLLYICVSTDGVEMEQVKVVNRKHASKRIYHGCELGIVKFVPWDQC